MNFPEDITHTYSNQVLFREIVRTKKVPNIVNVYTVPWDSFEMMSDLAPKYYQGIITVVHRPRSQERKDEDVKWAFYYDDHISMNTHLYEFWESFKYSKYKSRYIKYINHFYNENWVVDRELTLFNSLVIMLKQKGAQQINFYRPRKKEFWKNEGNIWFNTGRPDKLIEKHPLSAVLKDSDSVKWHDPGESNKKWKEDKEKFKWKDREKERLEDD